MTNSIRGKASYNRPIGISGIAFRCVEHALKDIHLKHPRTMDEGVPPMHNWEASLWLLTDAKDEFLPLIAPENIETYYKKIKDEVLKSKGYAVLKQVVAGMSECDAQTIKEHLANYDITLEA